MGNSIHLFVMHTAHKFNTFIVIRISFNIVKIKLHLIFFRFFNWQFFLLYNISTLFVWQYNRMREKLPAKIHFQIAINVISVSNFVYFSFVWVFKMKKMSHQVAIYAGSKITRIIIQIYFSTFRSKLKISVHREKDTSKNTITSKFVWKYTIL